MQPGDRDDEFSAFIDDALRALPAPRAPRTLLPRVLAAKAELRPRPWYTRAWLTWPAGWQVASLVVFTALAGGIAMLWPEVTIPQQVEVVPVLVRVFWRALLQ